MNIEQKETLIEAYLSEASKLKAWGSLPLATLDNRPSPEKWTIREHLVHLLDADINGISRARKAIAEPGSTFYIYDEEKWTAHLAYDSVDLELVVTTCIGLRTFMAQTLRGLVTKDWKDFYYLHPKNGKVYLEEYLQGYIDHVHFHEGYIKKLL